MLKIQQQIRELKVNQKQQARRIDLAELDAAISPFSSDDHLDVTKWFIKFEDYARICV